MHRKIPNKRTDTITTLTPSIPQQILINWESSEDAWCLKNLQLQPVYMNPLYSHLLDKGADGKACALSPFKRMIAVHDRRVTTEMRKVVATGVLPPHTVATLSIFECERMPFYDNQAHLTGIISHIKSIRMVTPRFFITGERGGILTTTCPPGPFSAKEWEVACLMMSGLSEKEMADLLCRSLRTIKFHKSNILSLTQCENTREFQSLARNKNWEVYIPPAFSRPQYIIGQ
ncbi:helix-turn-helix transcriptional regulator [Enterobacter sp. SORGH_AS_0287]|uniref:helix-turn-helix transcriptional regulator n=1 Tax=Enterobacter sp. SORGH_AS_0287 TaxID=3041779 RepID=UPI0028616AD9|nr:helix-turn-helix transcriptional regulator [Enterobacter sp. SORGH_AS_0287]MDR6367004.1 DNA-binding CsgD family transcriptional regulator [Enterobacter sp. SORGH_AS_0287]